MPIKFDDVDESGFEPLPRGWYDVRIEEVDIRETSQSSQHPNNEFWNVEMIVTGGDYEGRRVWTNVMLPPYTPFMLFRLLRAAGEIENKEDEWDGEPGDLEGLEFQVKVGRQKDDKDREDVKDFRPLDVD